jgi:predicted signal transduction protein with EAL and GGDEF domain
VNDTLGHQYGDQLLVHVGTRLSKACGDAFIARLGGDEFAFLAPGVATEEAALALGERLRAMLEQPVALEDVVVEVRASMGIALAPRHGRQLSGLLKRADIAMYDAKNSGTGIRLFDESLDDHSPSRLRLVSELRGALSSGEVTIEVQPKVRLDNEEVAGVEALVRWTHPEHGPLSPTQFVAIAERNGLIRQLTHRVLDVALAACASWVRAGLRVPIAVNLSPRALLDPDIVTTVLAALDAHGVPAGLLTLEITESSVMADPDRAIAALHELRRAGIGLSVDDFGTGYSSLSYLKRLPVQEVKIDRSFVVDLAQGGDGDTIVRSIVDLGTNLGLDVVAEGVEELSTWQRLRELRCTQAQGFFVSHPLPVDELPRWLAEHRAAVSTAASLLAR